MPPRKSTRSQKAASSTQSEPFDSAKTKATAPQLETADENPPHLFILPKGLSAEARFVSLPNPATAKLCRYLYCPHRGFFELTKVATAKDKATPRSFLLAQNSASSQNATDTQHESNQSDEPGDIDSQESHKSPVSDGYVLRDPDLLVATRFDPLFFLIPLFKPGEFAGENLRNHPALPAEDHFDTLAQSSPHMEHLLKRKDVRDLLEQNMERIFEKIDIGSAMVAYRQDHQLLVDELMRKAGWTQHKKTWPNSLEQMARRRVEVPASVNSAIRTNDSRVEEKVDGSPNDHAQALHEEDAEQSALPKDKACLNRTEGLLDQMRIVTCVDFMLASYIHPSQRKFLRQAMLKFTEIEEHLKHVEKVKSESQALQAISDNISRKRGGRDNDEAEFVRTEKKRKKEEEDKKKQSETRGIKDLKKVDTTGMKKMSSFFAKAPDKKK
ncbi:MAG: hypothetical protein M1831_007337 [Alyxoria varia]|nr:MAG: hypothetical protein M1831_007337 [Alyxoria varia]